MLFCYIKDGEWNSKNLLEDKYIAVATFQEKASSCSFGCLDCITFYLSTKPWWSSPHFRIGWYTPTIGMPYSRHIYIYIYNTCDTQWSLTNVDWTQPCYSDKYLHAGTLHTASILHWNSPRNNWWVHLQNYPIVLEHIEWCERNRTLQTYRMARHKSIFWAQASWKLFRAAVTATKGKSTTKRLKRRLYHHHLSLLARRLHCQYYWHQQALRR